jgi:hypothetical protein
MSFSPLLCCPKTIFREVHVASFLGRPLLNPSARRHQKGMKTPSNNLPLFLKHTFLYRGYQKSGKPTPDDPAAVLTSHQKGQTIFLCSLASLFCYTKTMIMTIYSASSHRQLLLIWSLRNEKKYKVALSRPFFLSAHCFPKNPR